MAKSSTRHFEFFGHRRWAHVAAASCGTLACLITLIFLPHNSDRSSAPPMSAEASATLATFQQVSLNTIVQEMDRNLEKYRVLGEYLARRYRVSREMTIDIVTKAHAIGQKFEVDPMLILAVISVESRFNPIAESAMGAKGLMQVIPRFHPEKLDFVGGEKLVFEPEANIMIGAIILKEYLRFTGDLGDALEKYAGVVSEENENNYSAKVTRERDRLAQVVKKYRPHPPSL